jgi:hypothetical protein
LCTVEKYYAISLIWKDSRAGVFQKKDKPISEQNEGAGIHFVTATSTRPLLPVQITKFYTQAPLQKQQLTISSDVCIYHRKLFSKEFGLARKLVIILIARVLI